MPLIELYLLFALSVGIWACVEFIPEIRYRLFNENRLDDAMYDKPILLFVVMLVISAVFAPVVAITILVPNMRESCITAMVSKV